MRIIVVTTIRNESDIIEAFVRYHCAIVDKIFIINHRSADSSGDILKRLKDEYLPIEVSEETSLDLQQGPFLTRLMKKAFQADHADWVIPLDADEFLSAAGDDNIRHVIQSLPHDSIVKVSWRTYVPQAGDHAQEVNVLRRILHYRSEENHNLCKILIPRAVGVKTGAVIGAGNHRFVTKSLFKQKEKELPYVKTDKLVLAHFPVRSSEQIISKAIVGWLACLAKPNKQPTENFHLKLLFDRVKSGDRISAEELTAMALGYATQPGSAGISRSKLVFKPLIPDSEAMMLRYTTAFTANPLPVLAEMAEQFAEATAVLRNKIKR